MEEEIPKEKSITQSIIERINNVKKRSKSPLNPLNVDNYYNKKLTTDTNLCKVTKDQLITSLKNLTIAHKGHENKENDSLKKIKVNKDRKYYRKGSRLTHDSQNGSTDINESKFTGLNSNGSLKKT